jgi:multicomponent Na+:H+ antiporter subunit E
MAEPTRRPDSREVRWRLWQQLPLLIALVLLWMLLWGEISPISLVSGVVVSVVVTTLFYLPPVELSGRFHPLWFVVFVARLAGELVLASFQVAWQAFAPHRTRTNAIVAVPLATSSDFIMTMTATAVSLVPGSLILEIDRDTATLYLHVLGVADEAELAKARAAVLATERSIVRALGSRDEVERMRA